MQDPVNTNASPEEKNVQNQNENPEPAQEETEVIEDQAVEESEFSPLTTTSTIDTNGGSNIEMLMDLELPISVELGRVKMFVKDILELGPGSVVELNKFSGEPVDVFVNNKKFAEGEVVVVDQNFGVRITALVGPSERLSSIQ